MVDFRYYLNRQGPRGQQGVKGEQGYSPQVTVGKNTASEFTLKVINEDGSFETENLKVVPENRGGTYVRYDKDTYQEYIGDPDIATTRTFGVVRLATKEDLGTQEESRAVTSALLNTYLQENYLNKVHGDVVTGDVSFRGYNTSFLYAPLIDGIKDELYNQYITRNAYNYTTAIGSLTIPDDDSRLTQGLKEIAYTSDLAEFVPNAVLNNAISNLVTLDTEQQITGNKNFANPITLNSVIKFNTSTALIKGDKSNLDIILGAYDDRLMVGSENTRPIKLNSNSITDYNGNDLLSYANIVAGDNITIEKTSTGVKISSTGGSVPDNMVTTDTSQDITGEKSFTTGKTKFKNQDGNRKVIGEIHNNGYYCHYYTDKASGEKPCYLGKVSQTTFNLGIPDLTGAEGRIFAKTLTKWDGTNEIGTILSTDNFIAFCQNNADAIKAALGL